MTSFLDFRREGAVALITMNRPETRNAISDDDAVAAVVQMCDQLNHDMSIRAAVLTGAGPSFSSGGNLKTLRGKMGSGLGEPVQSRYAYRDGIQRVPLAFASLEVPIIAAVNGPALGAGNDLACLCDIRIASENAVFAATFVKLGLIPGDGGAWLLPRVVGMSRACELAFTGDTIDASQALAWGLVSQVVPADDLVPMAMALAGRIARNSGHALRMTKRLLRESIHARMDTILEMSAGFQAMAHHTAEHEAALDAFLDRRA
ncbi:crotonase/enoyl-CoA hydratase family protein [Cupriavidus taiwanensis]|uniref:Enoyl-CoA hydratase n=1 Tax=Cupriavidus taiwanensis TaxID=164546 RepID=A0A375IJP6_9BURK|nr:crotonase/enoyl-CoA hydratase family protein [Cupriavidus taiwanensis]SOY63573.1 Enoyl-CoA hydratase [Cupriavidus taiwanensis]SOY63574.1 Enoyl-CoA hydratase [Cupriavidus taiwanensis]SOY93739.1 Enoyl-CoA hydratase [Cupriavidus taiwanensis]SOZ26994.1 Enoyl-CoA hydratase [Cupriavidus taiwanensis]SOZ77371.1 Enoyl-CoA hydratase [Cupriavidus taiwanensis]